MPAHNPPSHAVNVYIPDSILDRVKAYGEKTHRNRSGAFTALLAIGLDVEEAADRQPLVIPGQMDIDDELRRQSS